MRNPGRLLALAAICAAALWAASAPASALTVSVGGDRPTVPLPLPLPIGATASVGDGGPLQVGLQAPASTDVSVQAGPSGLQANATVANQPLLDVRAETAAAPPAPAPVTGSTPVNASPAPGAGSTGGMPAPGSAAPAGPAPDAASAPNARHATTPGARPGAVVSSAPRAISSVRHDAGNGASEVTASIASSPRAGFLTALPRLGARVLLWVALACAVLALRLFVGSATRATRAG